jgi:hypothetical protein
MEASLTTLTIQSQWAVQHQVVKSIGTGTVTDLPSIMEDSATAVLHFARHEEPTSEQPSITSFPRRLLPVYINDQHVQHRGSHHGDTCILTSQT